MNKTKPIYAVSIKLDVIEETEKALFVSDFQGIKTWLPKSTLLCTDNEYIVLAMWIVEAKKLNYSPKRIGWYRNGRFNMTGLTTTVVHTPEKIDAKETQIDSDLLK